MSDQEPKPTDDADLPPEPGAGEAAHYSVSHKYYQRALTIYQEIGQNLADLPATDTLDSTP